MRGKRFILFMFAAGLCRGAQPGPSPDARFVTRMAQANLAEVQISAWAKDHALSDEVRDFASKALDDHTKLADELRGLTVALVPPDLDEKDALEIDHMKTLEPNLLDRAFMRNVLKWQQRESDDFKAEIDVGKNQALRSWAAAMLPKVQSKILQGENVERAIGMDVETKSAGTAANLEAAIGKK